LEEARSIGVRERVLEFLANYGERGLAVLKAATEAAVAGRRSRGVRLGDFNYREVVARLRSWGLSYNPSMLLRILERDYGIIETSYRSSTQHWWNFIDVEAVLNAIEEYEKGVSPTGSEDSDLDPEAELVRAQIAALGVDELIDTLRKLALKPSLTRYDRALFRRLAFNELEAAVKLLHRAEQLGLEEAELLREALSLASKIARKLLREQKTALSTTTTFTERQEVVEPARAEKASSSSTSYASRKP
jgi:hypothetical protein